MKAALFTVYVRNENGTETAYCADNLTCYVGQGGAPAIAFICSGRLQTVLVAEVSKVELSAEWSHCGHCDSSVAGIGHYPDELPVAQA